MPVRTLHRLVLLGLLVTMSLGTMQLKVSAQQNNEEVAVPTYSGKDPDELPILAPCSRFADSYDDLDYLDKPLEEWPDMYHESVAEVVTESLEQPNIECTADNYEALLKPGEKLKAMAEKLPPWQDTDIELSRFDLSRVLLENLRIYECALSEYYEFRYYDTAKEAFDNEKTRQEEEEGRSPNDDSIITFFDFFLSDLMEDTAKRSDIIVREKAVARKALHRTLTLIGTMDRLLPLQAELECMQRMSLDIRNIAALSAETSSCIPRTWNAKDVLRDYKEDEEEASPPRG